MKTISLLSMLSDNWSFKFPENEHNVAVDVSDMPVENIDSRYDFKVMSYSNENLLQSQ